MSLGTWIYTLLNGDLIGKDAFGNRYYKGKGKKLHATNSTHIDTKSLAEG